MLIGINHKVDEMLIKNYKLMDNEAYFYGSITPIIVKISDKYGVKLTFKQVQFITNNIIEEYVEERKMAS